MTKSNSLINEKSPYLLQHADNPVDWFAWGEEAFEKARREDKPIFLSIGYSTCYWCHVMEREVFENEKIAAEMNRIFVNIKVDREERPDVDRVYMTALQSMSGSGGWPMSMFLDAELRPFYGATYIPPAAKFGMGGFEELIDQLEEAWKTRRAEITKSGTAIIEHIRNLSVNKQSEDELSEAMLLKGAQQFKNGFDEDYGGFGGAPKFPRPVGLNFLLHIYKRFEDNESLKMVIRTLLQMARGGVYDHLGGGFHRYSVDKFWRVPHFEKMLYDQAQLAAIYIDAYTITNDKLFADTAKEVLAYVSRMLTHKDGGFFSAEDAESVVDAGTPEVKEEGACYVWEYKEVESSLGEDAEIFCYYYGIEKAGNAPAGSDPHGVFTDKNILFMAHTFGECSNKFELPTDKINEIIEVGNKILFDVRQKRPMPHLDDKILTSWNGLMVSAYAKAYGAFGVSEYLDTAKRSAEFIWKHLYDGETSSLKHRWRDGEARFDGTLEDYAFFTQALIDLYEASFNIDYLGAAKRLCERTIEEFYDSGESGFFDTSGKDKSILVKTKEDYDSAEPTGNSIAVLNLLRIGEMLGIDEWKQMAEESIRLFAAKLTAQPYAMPQMLAALDFAITKPMQIVLSGPFDTQETQEMIEVINGTYNPGRIVIYNDGNELLKKWSMYTSNKPAAFVCENYSCRLPVHSANELKELLHN